MLSLRPSSAVLVSCRRMNWLRPPPPGTKLRPWVPDLIFIPISRAFERLADTRLMDVKLCDLRAWIARREKTPSAFYNEFMRNIWRVHNLYFSGPVFNNTIKTMFRFVFMYSFLNWLVKMHRYWDFQKTIYHW